MSRALDVVTRALDAHPNPDRSWLVGSPWFEPPEVLRRALEQVSSGASFDYPPAQGVVGLRTTVAEIHRRDGMSLNPENVVITHGAKGGLLAVFGVLVAPGDEILHPTPCYPAYPAAVSALGATPVAVPHVDGISPFDSGAFEDRITSKTRAIVVSSPDNPTGATLGGDQVASLVELCRKYTIRLICDEAYEAFRFAPDTQTLPAHVDPDLETVIQVRSFSKTFALCGWRIGYVSADPEMIGRLTSWQSRLLNPPNSIAQEALVSAPAVPADYSSDVRRRVRNRLERLVEVLANCGIPVEDPQGGFYVWADVRSRIDVAGSKDSATWCADLARRQGIGLWPGEDFSAPGWVRLSAVSCPDREWASALDRLTSGLKLPP